MYKRQPQGSGGLAGMAMSALSAPIYLKSFGEALIRRPSRFVVTPKGGDASPDRLLTFRIHLGWAALLAASLVASMALGHTHVAMRTWAVLAIVISLAPVAVWVATLVRTRRERQSPVPAARPADGTESALATTAPVSGTPTGGN